MNTLARLLIIVPGLLLAACAPMTQTPPQEPPQQPPAAKPVPPPARPAPVPPPPPEVRKPAPPVQSLLDQGWAHYRQQDYQGALSLAERAQRMDPRSPDVYLLMASAEFSLLRLDLAEQLVRKGLAMGSSGTPVYRQLQSLLGRITAAAP